MPKKTINLTTKELDTFLTRMDALNKISEFHKIKWLKNVVLFYAVDSEDLGNFEKVNSMRIYVKKREEFFSNFPEDLELIWTIQETKEFVKKYRFLLDSGEDTIKFKMDYNEEEGIIESISMKNRELEITAEVAQPSSVKDVPIDFVKNSLNPKNADFSKELSTDQFNKLKTLSGFDIDNLISINIDQKKLEFSQASWYLNMGEVDIEQDLVFKFNPKNFRKVVACDSYKFNFFETYLVIDENDSLVMFNFDL